MRPKILLLALTLAVFTGGCATKTETTAKPRTLEALFKKADRDGDGRVSRDEFTDFMIEGVFENYDQNGNGFVTQAEFVAGGGTAEGFRKINVSRTGKITLEEAKSSKMIRDTMVVPFDEADVNDNGFVTWDEFQQFRAKRQPYIR